MSKYLAGPAPALGWNTRGQLGIGAIVAIVVGVILVVAVAIPVTNDVINSANLTGTTKTIVQQIPILMAVVPLVAVTALFLTRRD